MFYGLSKFLKNLFPKRLFYRGLLIVAVPIIILQVTISLTKDLVIPLLVFIHKLSKKTKVIVICITTIGIATMRRLL